MSLSAFLLKELFIDIQPNHILSDYKFHGSQMFSIRKFTRNASTSSNVDFEELIKS